MQKQSENWYTSWFNTPYYHVLYKDRNEQEAGVFMSNLTDYLQLSESSEILDLACGRGRHAIYLNELGYHVTGVDLSRDSIRYAKQFENDRLHFSVHDMCLPFPKKFDAVFNLFTSFGYFEKEDDNLRTIEAIRDETKPGGFGVIDFLNVHTAIEKLIPRETKNIDGITFEIEKKFINGHIMKFIKFEDDGREYQYIERVKALTLKDFEAYFQQAKVSLRQCFGCYHLSEYDPDSSERLILIFN